MFPSKYDFMGTVCVHVSVGKKVAGDFHLDLETGKTVMTYTRSLNRLVFG